jgi:hypothetical protein
LWAKGVGVKNEADRAAARRRREEGRQIAQNAASGKESSLGTLAALLDQVDSLVPKVLAIESDLQYKNAEETSFLQRSIMPGGSLQSKKKGGYRLFSYATSSSSNGAHSSGRIHAHLLSDGRLVLTDHIAGSVADLRKRSAKALDKGGWGGDYAKREWTAVLEATVKGLEWRLRGGAGEPPVLGSY